MAGNDGSWLPIFRYSGHADGVAMQGNMDESKPQPAAILDRYPRNEISSAPLPGGIEKFCFPAGVRLAAAQVVTVCGRM